MVSPFLLGEHMSKLAPLYLKPKSERRIKGGHIWVYSNEVDTKKTPLKDFEAGEQAQLFSSDGKSLGVIVMSPSNLICARIISRTLSSPLKESHFRQKIERAKALRDQVYSEPFYRVVHGDADWFPGLVVDRFNDVLSVQLNSAFTDRNRDAIIGALVKVFSPRGIALRNDSLARSDEGLESEVAVAYGTLEGTVELIENETRFQIPVLEGQKTGWFFDHRENRRQLNRFVKDKRVLDVFSYIGGWGVQAAVHGASEVICVDASESATEAVLDNAELNGVEDRVGAIHGNAFDILKTLIDEGERFDVVVVDPPALIKRKKDIKAGEQAYHRLNQLAIRLLNPDGVLVSASCSMHLPRERLGEVVRVASRHVDRFTQIFYDGRQGFDHPVHPAIPETDYLKAIFCRVVKGSA